MEQKSERECKCIDTFGGITQWQASLHLPVWKRNLSAHPLHIFVHSFHLSNLISNRLYPCLTSFYLLLLYHPWPLCLHPPSFAPPLINTASTWSQRLAASLTFCSQVPLWQLTPLPHLLSFTVYLFLFLSLYAKFKSENAIKVGLYCAAS